MTSEARAAIDVSHPENRPSATAPSTAAGSRDVRIGGRRLEVDPHSCFACGELNEHGLHLVLHAQDGRCWTDLILDRRFQGWEGVTHGGILCAILDEVMAWSLVEHDAWGVTARLSLEFRRPVAVGAAVRAEGWLVDAKRRILKTAGRIVDARTGDVLATAEATYVAASEARKAELKARYRFRLVPEEPDDNALVEGSGGDSTDRVDVAVNGRRR